MEKQISYLKVLNGLRTIFLHILLVVMAVMVIYPVLWILSSSFNPGTGLSSGSLIPSNPTLDHYRRLFAETEFVSWYKNTLMVAALNMVASVTLTTTTAFIFARFKFVGKKIGLLTILILQMFPAFLGMIAIYILFLNFGLLNKPLALVIIYSAGQIPYNTWLVKGYLSAIPKSLDEAAMIDGATKIQLFFKIIFPLAKPIITFVAVTSFMAPWFDFILPRLLISTKSKFTLAIGLYDMINGNANNNFTMFAAGSVLVAVPITLLYTFLQKYLIEGVTAGANKG
jgi:arabinogalactan oligomer/maltooligosaccharide transport system permease protein